MRNSSILIASPSSSTVMVNDFLVPFPLVVALHGHHDYFGDRTYNIRTIKRVLSTCSRRLINSISQVFNIQMKLFSTNPQLDVLKEKTVDKVGIDPAAAARFEPSEWSERLTSRQGRLATTETLPPRDQSPPSPLLALFSCLSLSLSFL